MEIIKQLLTLILSVVPIFIFTWVGYPIVAVVWTVMLIVMLPFVVYQFFATDTHIDEAEEQIKHVRRIMNTNAPRIKITPPPVPDPDLRRLSRKQIDGLIERDIGPPPLPPTN